MIECVVLKTIDKYFFDRKIILFKWYFLIYRHFLLMVREQTENSSLNKYKNNFLIWVQWYIDKTCIL